MRTILLARSRWRQNALCQSWVLKIACLPGADRWNARDENQFSAGRQLHHLTRREQRPRRLLPRDHQMTEPRTEPMAGIVPQRPHLGRSPQGIRDALRGALVVRGKGHAYMAVIENGVVRPVGLLDLVEGLGDQKTLEAIAGHKRQRRLEEIQP